MPNKNNHKTIDVIDLLNVHLLNSKPPDEKNAPRWYALVAYEKKLAMALKSTYLFIFLYYIVGFTSLFFVEKPNQTYYLIGAITGFILFLGAVYYIVVKILHTHRAIGKMYQDVYDLGMIRGESPDDSEQSNFHTSAQVNAHYFEKSAKYLKSSGFIVYQDEELIIANKVLLQGHTGLIKRDYLLQVILTAKEFDIVEHLKQKQEQMNTYLAKFNEALSVTKNKFIKVGAFVHFEEEITKKLYKDFIVQALQRYLFKFDVIFDTKKQTLYYPSHIESYEYRQWSGKLSADPYNEFAQYIHTVFFDE